ncbi:MAG TPA: EthD domain-containing protein [Sphingomonas sp.]|nr:EthD domain-containing protein [Sphingomonas sp.]
MVKTIGFMVRRPDITRAAFREHYETRHAPLAVPLFPFRRYRRNHLIDQAAEPGFDCISEFWFDSIEAIAALMAGEVGATMRADERNFLDQSAVRAAVAREALPGPAEAAALCFLRREDGEDGALEAAFAGTGAGLDLLTPFDRPLPFDAIAALPPGVEPPAPPPGWRAGPCLAVERRESKVR